METDLDRFFAEYTGLSKPKSSTQTIRRVHDIDLTGSSLVRFDLSGLNADHLDLRAADMRGAKLCAARFGECSLIEVHIEGADWSRSTLRNCFLDNAHGTRTCFDGASIEDSSAKGIDLTLASLKGAKLTETSLERAMLHKAVFDNAEGIGVGFRGADLSDASLRGVRFDEPDFRGADLRNADLRGGRFHNGDFRGAMLEGTSFEGADCRGALFDSGSGPDVDVAKPHDQPKGSEDQTFGAMIEECLTALFPQGVGRVQDIADNLKTSFETFSATSNLSPDELRQWADSLIALAKREPPVDLDSVIDTLCKGPIGIQRLMAKDQISHDDIVDRVRNLVQSLSDTKDQPPPWVKKIILDLRDEWGLDGTATAQEVLALLLSGGGP